ncbi:hypothetical protein OROMI_023858 [Orobanche minor]
MKVPFSSNCPTTSKPRPLDSTVDTATTYEPKSILDIRRSPSPVADHALIDQNSVDWDSLMRELGLHDDPSPLDTPSHPNTRLPPPTQYSTHPDLSPAVDSLNSTQFVPADDLGILSDIPAYSEHSFDGLAPDFDYVDELIRLADCFDTNSVQLVRVILARLDQLLTSPSEKPLQRAAFYFKEAFQSLLTGSTRTIHHPANPTDIVQTINAHKIFSNISPIPLFSSFTANQAMLEALDGSSSVHVIDFDIGLGGQWASFMRELADESGSIQAALRISALVSEEYANESELIRENLTQFALELNIRFDIEFVLIRTFEYLSFKAIEFADGEKVAVLLSPAIFRNVGTGFLNDLRRISPQVVVHVGVAGNMDSETMSYRQAVIDGLEFYSTFLKSLEAANYNGGCDGMMSIETFVVLPRIMEAVARRGTWWREALAATGLRQVGPSQFAEFQAECLLRRLQVRGFHVVKRQAEMVLCWHDRPIVATSAWKY